MRNIIFLTVISILFSLASTTYAQNLQGDLGNNTFINPILGGDYPDPTVLRDGDDYYMTHSAFEYVPGLVVFHSKDLVNWQPISYGLQTYLGSVWAPDICKFNDKFYIYFTVAGSFGFSNFVVWSDSPYGPWSEPIDLKIGNIDPCPATGEDGSRWLFLSAGNRVKLADDGLSIIPETFEKVYNGWQYPEDWVTEGFHLEGPKIKKIGDYYYYLNAQGGTAGPPTSHMVVVARSKSINGPWKNDPGNPLIHTYNNNERWWSKGHGSLIDTPDGKWWIFYHAYENQFTNLGRQTLLEPVEITTDGWLKAPLGTRIESPIRKPIVSQKEDDRRVSLNQFRIGLDWKYFKNYDAQRTQVNNGVLTMKAQGTNPAESAPLMFVAGTRGYEFSTHIELTGNATAGLILYYNAKFYVGNGFDKESRYGWRRGGGNGSSSHKNGNKMWFKLKNDNNVITGYFSQDGINWNKEDWGDEISGYNHNTLSDFLSLLPGIFVYGDGEAKFSNFNFTILE
ncbi:family 43 glycosylhydrolase [Prevotella sp. 10(H)]|uniref:family 43 glycosylhydrolase n=1 Tax=Prevotella sp. 10(H) TaxID=1158294 RepID=UPI0004A73964|nr:family 43 glycosylhydrolase [Prevotella sp. 10(H)]